MMTPQTQRVLAAIEPFGQAHAHFRAVQAEVWHHRQQLEYRWRDRFADLLDDTDDDTAAAAEDELTRFLTTGERDQLELLAAAATTLAAARPAYAEQLDAEDRRLQQARHAVADHHQAFATALRRWHEQLHADGGPPLSEWAPILKAWRAAADLTAREAAQLLGLSPSAVWRYEERQRRPSPATVDAMVAAITTSTTLELHDTEPRAAASYLAAAGFADTGGRLLERGEPTELRDQLAERLDQLGARELRAVAALVAEPAAVTALVDWAAAYTRHPLQPVIDAVAGASAATPAAGHRT